MHQHYIMRHQCCPDKRLLVQKKIGLTEKDSSLSDAVWAQLVVTEGVWTTPLSQWGHYILGFELGLTHSPVSAEGIIVFPSEADWSSWFQNTLKKNTERITLLIVYLDFVGSAKAISCNPWSAGIQSSPYTQGIARAAALEYGYKRLIVPSPPCSPLEAWTQSSLFLSMTINTVSPQFLTLTRMSFFGD